MSYFKKRIFVFVSIFTLKQAFSPSENPSKTIPVRRETFICEKQCLENVLLVPLNNFYNSQWPSKNHLTEILVIFYPLPYATKCNISVLPPLKCYVKNNGRRVLTFLCLPLFPIHDVAHSFPKHADGGMQSTTDSSANFRLQEYFGQYLMIPHSYDFTTH